jgi:formylglycine-generating enzyme required for sulfatase activity
MSSDNLDPEKSNYIVIQPSAGLVGQSEGDSSARAVPERRAGEEQDFEIAPGVKIVMCWIPPGEFLMGSPKDEVRRDRDETQHLVKLTNGYWLAKTQTTQAEWEAVMDHNNPSEIKGSDLPIQSVSWIDISESGGFMEKVNRFAAAGAVFSLPTEAQWEYACRAGTTTALNTGGNVTEDDMCCLGFDQVAWHNNNSGKIPHWVGWKKANAWGLCDMHGNVWEWCLDWYGVYTDEPQIDPKGPDSGSCRVARGGSCVSSASYCRAANRYYYGPDSSYFYLGFRIARNSEILRK